jgi:molybdopterin molybdotransferase
LPATVGSTPRSDKERGRFIKREKVQALRTVEEAFKAIIGQVTCRPVERVPLLEAAGRVLAETAYADIDLPPFDNSAVDGYAVAAIDTAGATAQNPCRLRTLDDVPAGAPALQTVHTGAAVRVMTGGPLPPGADAMVMIEDTALVEAGWVEIREEARPEQHVRRRGEEMRCGDPALSAGVLLRPAEVGMLATLGFATAPVYRQARVAIVTTGDEVVDVVAGERPPPGHIRNSNRYMLAALVQEAGGTLHSLTHVRDDLAATEEAFRALSAPETGADVILTAGGVSVGDRDFVKPALEKLGRLDLWRVAMKPGKPVVFGRIGETLFFGLPGNPVSARVTFELFVRPALWKMMGRTALDRFRVRATLTHAVSHIPGRREYVRAVTRSEGERLLTTPTDAAQGSGILSSLTAANSLLIVPTEAEALAAESIVEVILL